MDLESKSESDSMESVRKLPSIYPQNFINLGQDLSLTEELFINNLQGRQHFVI